MRINDVYWDIVLKEGTDSPIIRRHILDWLCTEVVFFDYEKVINERNEQHSDTGDVQFEAELDSTVLADF
jgi:hypothetical protein